MCCDRHLRTCSCWSGWCGCGSAEKTSWSETAISSCSVVELGDDVGGSRDTAARARLPPFRRDLLRPAATVQRLDTQRLEGVRAEPRGGGAPRPETLSHAPCFGSAARDLVVGSVEGHALALALAAAAERAHDLIAQLFRQAPEHVSLVPVIDREAPALSGYYSVPCGWSDSRLPFSNDSGRTPAWVYTDLIERVCVVGQDLAHLAQEVK